MNPEIEEFKNAYVIRLKEKNLGVTDKVNLHDTIDSLNNKEKAIILDLAEVETVDSTILGLFLRTAQDRKNQDDKGFALLHVNESVKKMLDLTRLSYLLNISDNLEELLNQLND